MSEDKTAEDATAEETQHPLWECPACGYLVSHEQYTLAAYDYPCPRCHALHLSSFRHSKIKLTGAGG